MYEETFRIGVLSDTHLSDSQESRDYLCYLLEEVMSPLDMVLHAGDLVSSELLDVFADYPFHAVRGNMDPASPGVPIKKVINAAGFTIGLIHGWGPVEGIEERALEEFSEVSLDCLVYGHSHHPVCHTREGVLYFNPGSATDRRGMPYHSVGVLEIDTEVRGTIIRID